MKSNKSLSILPLLLILLLAYTARAQETTEKQPPKYRMELVWLADSDEGRREYIFLVGSVAFKSVEGLKKFVARMERGTVIEWDPGCLRWGDEPLLSSPEEMRDWMEFCEEHGIKFVLVPSG